MAVADILSVDRVSVSNEAEGLVRDKPEALRRLAKMLANGQSQVDEQVLYDVLAARERLQSTGIGGGVAVPHGSVDSLDRQLGALLVCPKPIPFDAIDGEPVTILFALVGPKGAPAEHLKILARVSKLLRSEAFRVQLSSTGSGAAAYELITSTDRGAA